MRAHQLLLLAASAATLCVSCVRPATQLVVLVESDLPPAERACVHVAVTRVGTSEPPSETFFFAEGTRTPRGEVPFSLGVAAPGGDASRRVEVRVSALRSSSACDSATFAESAVAVTRRVRTGFLPEQSLLVPVFLSARCGDVVCGAELTCEEGACVPIPDLDPSTLRPVRPGEELEGVVDAGARDAGAGRDAGPTSTSFAAALPAASYSLEAMRNQPVYPVGVSGADRVLVAGIAGDPVTVGGTAVPAGNLWLAKLAPDGAADWVTTVGASVSGYPIIERMVRYANGYVLCGTALFSSFSPVVGGAASPISCMAERCGVVARLGDDGSFQVVHTLDATTGEVWCTDLSIDGNRAYVGARTFETASLRSDGAAISPAAGTLDGVTQNVLLFEIADVAGAFAIAPPIVVGHNPSTFGVMFGNPGATLFVRPDGSGGRVLASPTQALSLAGASPGGSVALRVARFSAAGASLWATTPVGGTTSFAFDALSVSPTDAWLAVTVSGGETARFGMLPPITVDRLTSYLLRLDLGTGAVMSATAAGSASYSSGEDRFISDPISSMLFGGRLATTSAGDALFASTVVEGDVVDGAPRTVVGERDALLGIVGPTGAVQAGWQWSARPEMDSRLTHVEWMPGGWVAIGGYIEADAETWGRAASFFEIHPAR